MTVSVLFILLLVWIVFFCLKQKTLSYSRLYKELFFLQLFFSITFVGGYAIKIENTNVAYTTFLSLLLFLLSFPFLFKGKFNKKILFAGVIFAGSILVGLVLKDVFPYTGGVVKNLEDWDYIISGSRYISYSAETSDKLFNLLLCVIRYPVILAVISRLLTDKDIIDYIDRMYKAIPVFIIFGIVEIIAKKLLAVNIYELVSIFTGTINEFNRIQGFTKEASQYATVLFMYCIIVVVHSKRYDSKQFKDKFVLFLLMAIMLLTSSLIGYYLFLLFVLLLLKNSNGNQKIVIIFAGFIGMLLLLIIGIPSQYVERFNRVIDVLSVLKRGEEYHSFLTSEGARISSIQSAINAFIARPVFGVGIGTTDAHSQFFSMLANIGAVGVICYFDMWKNLLRCKNWNTLIVFWIFVAATLLMGGLGNFSELYFPFLCMAYSVSARTTPKKRAYFPKEYHNINETTNAI